MQTRGWLNFKVTVLLVLVSILFAGCQIPGVPIIEPTITPVVDEELFISAQIQNTLNDYNTALEKNDKTLFMSTIDQGNSAVKESFSVSFDDMENSGFVKTVKLGMTLINIEQKKQGLVVAHIRRDRDGWQADWFFRQSGDKWVISEPTAEEAGAPQETTSGNYTFITYPITDDVNEKIIPLLSKVREHVLKDLGEVPTGKVQVTVYPSILKSPLESGGVSSWRFSTVAGGADAIYMVSPTSCYFGFYDPQTGWGSDIEMLLTHELARIAYVRNFGNPGQGADWFSEGLAQYVAGYNEMPDVAAAVQNDSIIPIIDTTSSDKKIDLAHFANLGNGWLGYGFSESLVIFIVEKYGGLNTFWTLARSYDETQDMKTAIKNTLGITYEQFDTSWREWLKEDYIKR